MFALCRIPNDNLETFNFLENAEDSDEEEDEEGDLMDDISSDKQHRPKKHKPNVRQLNFLLLGFYDKSFLLDVVPMMVDSDTSCNAPAAKHTDRKNKCKEKHCNHRK